MSMSNSQPQIGCKTEYIVTALYSMIFSLILLTPFIHSASLYNGIISAKQIWFYGAMSLLILTAGSSMAFNRRNVFFSLNYTDVVLLVFYAYYLIRAATTNYVPVFHNQKLITLSLLLILYFIIKTSGWLFCIRSVVKPEQKDHMQKKHRIITNSNIYFYIIHFLILTGLIEAVWGLLQLYGVTGSLHSGYKMTGTFFNPAPYALYLSAVFPLALGSYLRNKEICAWVMNESRNERNNELEKGNKNISFLHSLTLSFLLGRILYYISLLTVISIILVLPATMNRASWLGAAAGTLLVMNYRYYLLNRVKAFLNNTIRKLCVIVIIIIIAGLTAAGLFYLKKGSSVGRLFIWEVTIGKIAGKPLFGYGAGRFEAEYNNWQAKYFMSHPREMDGPKGMVAGNTRYCFNEYLEMTSELGIVGLLLFLAVIISIFMGLGKGIMTNVDVQSENDQSSTNGHGNFLIPSLLIPSLVSVLVCAMISFPFYSLPTHILFFVLLAILSSQMEATPFFKNNAKQDVIKKHFSNATALMLIPVSIVVLFAAGRQHKMYTKWNEAAMLYQASSYTGACESFSECYPVMRYTGLCLQYYGKALNMQGEYQSSIRRLKRAGLYTSDEILYATLGDSYKSLKMYSEAEDAYRYASYMAPHKLYPLYLLAVLYDETGQKEKAIAVAEKTLKKEVKVESEATEEILQAMKRIVNRNSGERTENRNK